MMEEGHYMVFRRVYSDPEPNPAVVVETYYVSWPRLISTDIDLSLKRGRSPSQTCTPSLRGTLHRNTQTRIAVRMRDQRCLATGQAAVKRARGGNFTGLEVAHIFPLMAVGNRNWTNLMSESAREKVATRRAADTSPHNAILLRADVHSLFDDYQWSIWIEPEQGMCRIVRFEKSGATALEECETVLNLRPPNLGTTAPCSIELLQEHFYFALLIHVKGFGRRAVAGYVATLL